MITRLDCLIETEALHLLELTSQRVVTNEDSLCGVALSLVDFHHPYCDWINYDSSEIQSRPKR